MPHTTRAEIKSKKMTIGHLMPWDATWHTIIYFDICTIERKSCDLHSISSLRTMLRVPLISSIRPSRLLKNFHPIGICSLLVESQLHTFPRNLPSIRIQVIRRWSVMCVAVLLDEAALPYRPREVERFNNKMTIGKSSILPIRMPM